MPKPQKHVFVCVQNRPPTHPKGCCSARGGTELLQTFAGEFDKRGLFGLLGLTSTGCLGPCEEGPNVLVYPEGILYAHVTKEDVPAIIEEHLLGNKPLERLLVSPEIWS